MTAYNPQKKARTILNAALGYIESVGYPVGLRWVFYRLLQDGTLKEKNDYDMLKGLASKARKGFWNGWKPDTLIDEGRHIDKSLSPVDQAEMLSVLHLYIDLTANLFDGMSAVPFLIYEAATSTGQFEHFALWADRAALRGDASIPHKWAIAKRCESLANEYGLPVHILYFGDYDKKGLGIPESALGDIRSWVNETTELRYTRVGINPGHSRRFNLPKKQLSPDTYEWESLGSDDARTLIMEGLATVVDLVEINERIKLAKEESLRLAVKVEAVLSRGLQL